MNRIYRSIWNSASATFVAVSENVSGGHGNAALGTNSALGTRFVLNTVAVSLALAFGSAAQAQPTGGVVAAGTASIVNANGNTTINQSSQNAILNWQSFSIGAGNSVNFVQPNSNAVALNRVLGSDPSSILGSLTANGKVFLVNPNGILFGQGAQVNVGGLVASTRNISDSDFMAGNYQFAGSGSGSILNQGSIHAAEGGYVALLGANVSNQGTISAKLGTVALAAGNAITLDVAGDGLLNVAVNQGAVNALVNNGGLIQSDGGQVLLSAQGAGQLLQTAVNNTGVIQAHTIENHNGTIKLLGDMQSGTVNVGGRLDASAPNGGNGGFIETSAAHVKIADDTHITTAAAQGLTGSWLIDPADYIIAASGGDITGAQLSANLGLTNVTILSTSGGSGSVGDVNVNDAVNWSANKLTLNAQNNININTVMNASGTASLALQYGQGAVAAGNTSAVNVNAPINLSAGNNFSTKQGSDGSVKAYTVITSLGAAGSVTTTDLQGVNGNLAGNYVLGANIDAAATSGWNSGGGFSPVIGSEPVTMGGYTYTNLLPFTGIFDGLGHTISGLTIDQPTAGNIGMFGLTSTTGVIRNVGLLGGSVTGAYITGALVAENRGSINNSYATGSVTGNAANGLYVGGLVGSNFGSISDSYATGTVSGQRSVGGLVGTNGTQGGSSIGAITRSHSTGAVTAGTYNSGGLAGNNEAGSSIIDSYATGAVSGGKNNAGGLVGANYGSISTSYATGAVTDIEGYVGGLVGSNGYSTGSIALSYSSGTVSGGNNIGGLLGKNFGSSSAISDSYWNTDTSGLAGSGGGTGLTSVQMQTGSNFAGFNFTTTPGATGNNWVMVDVDGSLNNAGGALGATRPMLASEYSTTINNAHQLQLMAMKLAGSYTLGQNINAAATGTANDVWAGSTFVSIGNNTSRFTGKFDGFLHTIGNLTINMPSTSYVGLFGANGGLIQNVGLTGGSVTGGSYVGGLVGNNADSNAVINNSYNTGSVSGSNYIGGIAGQNWSGAIRNSYATGNVTGTGNNIGGLVGYGHNSASVNNSYATGVVTGTAAVGGLMGSMNKNSSITNSYATGSVTGNNTVGGLIGGISSGAGVSNSYATGFVTGSSQAGGLIGVTGSGTGASNSYWDRQTSGQAASAGGAGAMGLTTVQMKTSSAFSGFDFANTWVMYDNYTNPLLRSLMTALTVTVNNVTKTYDGTAYSGNNGAIYSTTPNGNLLGAVTYSGTAQGAINAGTYGITAGGLYSSQQGYAISYTNGALTVNPYAVNLTGTRTYDGTAATAAGIFTLGALVGSETLTLSGSGTVASKNTGTGKTVTLGTLALGDSSGLASNYTFIGGTRTANITQANLTLSTGNVSKTYDGGLSAAGAATVTGALFGSDAISGGTFAYTDKNVGSGNKTVTTSGVTVADGNGGGNYNVSYASNTTSTITRLNAVTWVGGATGNWFDPANWAGGAVPDLANVANVIIPAGVIVSFNNANIVSPVQAGIVNVDSISSRGGMSLSGGSLNVTNGLQLTSLDQSGGTLGSGTITVGNFSQSGGTLASSGAFTVTNAYSQSSSSATVNVGGNAAITQTSGSAMLGNITTSNTLGVTAVAGDIIQLAGTRIVLVGGGLLAAPNGKIALASSGNNLGAVTISDDSSLAIVPSRANDARLQSAVTSAISMSSFNTLEDNADTSSSTPSQPLHSLSSGSSASGILAGLNVTLVGQGVKLPPNVQPSDAADQENDE